MKFERPRIVLSTCLEIEACRYNGQMIRSSVVRGMMPWVDFVPVCPEVEVGLGTPRDPIRLVHIEGRTHLVQPSTDKDLTEAMSGFAQTFLDGMEEVDGFLLKSRSPSCGIDGARIFGTPDGAEPVGSEPGMFAAAVLRRFPITPVEHEGRLTDLAIRDDYLTAVFALAGLRRVRRAGTIASLVDFQTRQKLTLMARSPSLQASLGRVVANTERRSFPEVLEAYEGLFRQALAARPDRGAHQNVIQHAQGYLTDRLSPGDRARFGRLVVEYREGRLARGALLERLRFWVDRLGEEYLARQSYLHPYPSELAGSGDSA